MLVCAGCASLPWHSEHDESQASCRPDRSLTWADFSRRPHEKGKPLAETGYGFRYVPTPAPHIEAVFSPTKSWVVIELADSWNPFRWPLSRYVLRHEQTHFAIACALARQATHALRTGRDPRGVLFLVEAVALRVNVQYDKETNHGSRGRKQVEWEEIVTREMRDGVRTDRPEPSEEIGRGFPQPKRTR
jgi:hypothetical protein